MRMKGCRRRAAGKAVQSVVATSATIAGSTVTFCCSWLEETLDPKPLGLQAVACIVHPYSLYALKPDY